MKTITFKCSASCGDMIYSLIFVKTLCEKYGAKAVYYIHHDDPRYSPNRKVNTLQACKRLFEAQPYIEACEPYHSQRIDYDLDRFRRAGNLRQQALPSLFFMAHGYEVPEKWTPWLTVPTGEIEGGYAVFNGTNTYTNHGVAWADVLLKEDRLLFIGLEDEYYKHESLCDGHAETSDLLDCAMFIAHSTRLYCNQSACLTIAQGLGHEVYLAKDRRFNNTVLGLETLLT